MKLVNFGSLNIDRIYAVEDFVKAGETISSLKYSETLGGKGLNQSVAARRAGAELIHVGTVGKDGQIFLDVLEEEGISSAWVNKIEMESGHAIIQVTRSGENAIIVHKGANHSLDKKRINQVFAFLEEKAAVLLQNEISNVDYILKQAHDLGHYTIFNPSPITEELLDLDLSLIDLLIVNENEAKALFKRDSIAAVLEVFYDQYPEMELVITLGSRGSLYVHKDTMISQKAYLHEVIDTTAAGDTFAGYFIANKLTDAKIETCLDQASRASGLAVTRMGALPSIPFRSDLG